MVTTSCPIRLLLGERIEGRGGEEREGEEVPKERHSSREEPPVEPAVHSATQEILERT